MVKNNFSIAAKIYLYSGKIPELQTGFKFFKTPTGESINSKLLCNLMTLSVVSELFKEGKIEIREENKKLLFFPAWKLLHLKAKSKEGIGLGKLILEKAKDETDLPKIIMEIIGGMSDLPEYLIIAKVEEELKLAGLYKEQEVKKFLGAIRREKIWEQKEVEELNNEYKSEVEEVIQKASGLPLAVDIKRNVNIGIGKCLKPKERDSFND
jgi:hypothetical protein